MRTRGLGRQLGWFCVALLTLAACRPDTRSVPPSGAVTGTARAPVDEVTSVLDSEAWFVESSAAVGLDFVHVNGATGDFLYPEILPPGVGLFDYDNDGDLDAFVVQGRILAPGKTLGDLLVPQGQLSPPTGRLFRNDLRVSPDGSRVLHFVDVTRSSRIVADRYGMGVAAGDIDNDGWVDLLVTNLGPSQLFHNNGDGTFADISQQAGIARDDDFAVSAVFVDYDRDGWLDLYVGNNVVYDLARERPCRSMSGLRSYCPPRAYDSLPDRLYRNRGNGTFDDVTATALQGNDFGRALGVVAADFDDDGWPDIYVANDGTENLLWMNQRDGTLRDTALLAGAALSETGTPEASMGLGAGDFDNDGDEDLFMTHMRNEGNNLYVNSGTGLFQDRSAVSGLGAPSLSDTGFGTTWVDVDNDGWLDILAVNGTVLPLDGRDDPFPYAQRKTLFRNRGNGTFEDLTDMAGPAFQTFDVGRGAAFGDVDNDGDVDVLVGNDAGPIQLLVNMIGNRHHWIGLKLVGPVESPRPAALSSDQPRPVRDMLGARVSVIRSTAPTLWRRVHTDGSYASANDPRVLVGLGTATEQPTIRIQWPEGDVEEFTGLQINRWTTVVRGTGQREEAFHP